MNDDLISREETLTAFADYVGSGMSMNDYDALWDIIVKMPSVKQEPKTGKWVHRNDDFNDWLECSECGYGSEGEVKFGEGTNFCPHCGADMRDKA